MGRTSRAVVGLGSWVAVVACAACSAEAPDTSFDETGEEALGSEQAPNILFPGDPACGGGCEKSLAGDEVFIPATNGKPWGQTYLKGTSTPKTLGGYSSGRIALLRRLALKNDGDWAVMLDPSWDDGTRDFLDDDNPATRPSVKPTTGPAIVKAWLSARADRRFLLVYSTTSAGSKGYAALTSDPEVGEPRPRLRRHGRAPRRPEDRRGEGDDPARRVDHDLVQGARVGLRALGVPGQAVPHVRREHAAQVRGRRPDPGEARASVREGLCLGAGRHRRHLRALTAPSRDASPKAC